MTQHGQFLPIQFMWRLGACAQVRSGPALHFTPADAGRDNTIEQDPGENEGMMNPRKVVVLSVGLGLGAAAEMVKKAMAKDCERLLSLGQGGVWAGRCSLF